MCITREKLLGCESGHAHSEWIPGPDHSGGPLFHRRLATRLVWLAMRGAVHRVLRLAEVITETFQLGTQGICRRSVFESGLDRLERAVLLADKRQRIGVGLARLGAIWS